MKPVNEWNSFRMGLVALLVLGVMGAGVVALSVMNFGTDEYTVELDHTAGLRNGEDVQINGVRKGKVTGVELDGSHVLVTFVLDSDIELGSRTTASVQVATLLGTHYLAIEPEGGGTLADGRIPLDRTTVPFNLQDVLDKGRTALDEFDPELLASALAQMADTLGASQQEIEPALRGVARVSEVIANRSDQANALLAAARDVSDQLSRSSGDIVDLMAQTNLVVSEVTARREAIHRLLVETTSLAQSLTAIINSTKGDLQPALRDLNATIDMLNSESDTLSHVLDVMAPALRYLANATGNGPWVDLYLTNPAFPGDDTFCGQRGGCQ